MANPPSPRTDNADSTASTSELERLADEVVRLKQELWIARDAVMGATAELGVARARIVDLEAQVAQLRGQMGPGSQAILNSRTYKVGLAATAPVRLARRVLR